MLGFFVFLVWLGSGWAIPVWAFKAFALKQDDKDSQRALHWFGFSSPDPEWQAVLDRARGGTAHDKVNVVTEWARLDSQRAAKMASFVAQVMILLLVVLGVI